jgi:hypothetical protein
MRALGAVMERSMHLCGKSPCGELAYSMVLRLGWQSAALLGLCMIAAPNVVLVWLQILGRKAVTDRLELSLMQHRKQRHQRFKEASPAGVDDDPCHYYGCDLLLPSSSSWTARIATVDEEDDSKPRSSSWMTGCGSGGISSSRDCKGSVGGSSAMYSPALRMRKAAYFNCPVEFGGGGVC